MQKIKFIDNDPSFNILLKSDRISIEIHTARLLIRSYENSDLKDCIALYSSKKNTSYFDCGIPLSKKDVIKLAQRKGENYFRNRIPFGLFSIFDKHKMSFIGQIDLIPVDKKGTCEIGFILDEKYHNQGFCSEAVHALTQEYVRIINSDDRFSQNYTINRIIATVHPANLSSRRVLEKNGMRMEEILKRFGQPRLLYSHSLVDPEKPLCSL